MGKILCEECEREVTILDQQGKTVLYSCGHRYTEQPLEQEVEEIFKIVGESVEFYMSMGLTEEEALMAVSSYEQDASQMP